MTSRDDVLKATLIFDAKPPRRLSQEEHFIGFLTDENKAWSADGSTPKGLEGYMLELADACKGFRVVVAGPTFIGIMKRYVKGFIFEERSRARPRAGTWRGYAVFVDEALEPSPDELDEYPHVRARLAATGTGPAIGHIQVINWEAFYG